MSQHKSSVPFVITLKWKKEGGYHCPVCGKAVSSQDKHKHFFTADHTRGVHSIDAVEQRLCWRHLEKRLQDVDPKVQTRQFQVVLFLIISPCRE